MTKEEKQKAIDALKISAPVMPVTQEKFMEYVQTINKIIDWLEQEPCDDAINRQSAIEAFQMFREYESNRSNKEWVDRIETVLNKLSSVNSQSKMGQWKRMSDLSEQEDDRYKCSRCGNVVHYKNKMNLYTFNSWCGRCGSDNRRKQGVGNMKIDIEKMAHIVAEKAIQELRDNGLFVSIWIPVSEGLPEENKTVMASTKYGVFPEARYTEEDGWEWAYESGADYWQELDNVEAWMPLPKRYKPQERSDKK